MTVSFLFGWQHILTGLLLLLVLAVLFFAVLAAGRGSRADWQAGLQARSRRRDEFAPDEEPADSVR